MVFKIKISPADKGWMAIKIKIFINKKLYIKIKEIIQKIV